jgi:hypothetical protein
MTVLSPAQIVGSFQIAPLAPSGGSSGPAGAGLGGAISNDWSNARHGIKKQKRASILASIKKAKAASEAGQTKAERLAAQQSGGFVPVRRAGSNEETKAIRGAVTKAAASLAGAVMDTDISDPLFRSIRETLRQRYPGAKLSDMLQEGARLESMLLSDPLAAYDALLSAYSRTAPVNGYVAPKYSRGLRGSLQRAAQDQADQEDLSAWIARYGTRLPKIMAELECMDRDLRTNPGLAAARLAVRIGGAPAVSSEIPAWEAKQAQKQYQKYVEQRREEMHQGVCLAIHLGHIPGDADTLNEMAAIMAPGTRFQHHPTDPLISMQRAAAIARHPAHVRLTARTGGKAPARSNAGSLSPTGGPSAGQQSRNAKGTGSFKDSIARVRNSM